MILKLAPSFYPESDVVLVEIQTFQNDGITPVLADQVEVVLNHGVTGLIGEKTVVELSRQVITSTYSRQDKSYLIRFLHPRRRVDLEVEVTATIGLTTLTETAVIAEISSPFTRIDLPENALWERDPLRTPLDGGPAEVSNPNEVVLAPPVADYVRTYEFTLAAPPENFADLGYSGGGNRLLLSNKTNSFELQYLDRAPWQQYAYSFMEGPCTNLVPNSFFLNAGAGVPVGWDLDTGSAFVMKEVVFDYATSGDAKLWRNRIRQQNVVSAFNEVEFFLVDPISVTALTQYTFSVYARVRLMTALTSVSQLKLVFKWFNGTTPLPETEVVLPAGDYTALGLAVAQATSPGTANNVVLAIRLGSVDAGDDVEASFLGPQLEVGPYATSRTLSNRVSDSIVVANYNPSDQKIRMEFIAGFGSNPTSPIALTTGPLLLTVQPGNNLQAEIPGQGTVSVPLVFQAGDVLDITVRHKAGDALQIYSQGQLLGGVALSTFVGVLGNLEFLGGNYEMVRLTVFSRS